MAHKDKYKSFSSSVGVDIYLIIKLKLNKFRQRHFVNYSVFKRPKTLNKIFQFSIPTFEKGALNLVNKVFPEFRNKFNTNIELDSLEVKRIDNVSIDVFTRKKSFKLSSLNGKLLIKVIDHMWVSMGLHELSYYSILDNMECISILPSSTSSCDPLFKKKNDPINVSFTLKMMEKFDSIFNIYKKSSFLYSFISTVFHRFTPKVTLKENGSLYIKHKPRMIFGVSHFICALEVKYLFCFVEQFKKSLSGKCTIGKTRLEISEYVSNMRKEAAFSNRLILCGDIKGHDMSVPPEFHIIIFNMWMLAAKNYSKAVNSILCLQRYLTYTPFGTYDKDVKLSYGSTTSGSWITSVFATFTVMFSLNYAFYKLYGFFPDDSEIIVQGDDFLILIEEESHANVIKEELLHFNLRLKVSSTAVCNYNDKVEFLGFNWDYKNEPLQHNSWFISRILFPERRVDCIGPDRIISRYLSLIFQVSNSNELFKRFYHYDSYLKDKILREDEPSFYLIDSLGNIHESKFPIKKFLNWGWKLF